MELRRRERTVLAASIALYLQTGRAVASRQVARARGQELSPASIRNLMAGLEEKGYLSRPHTSAGCIPTDAGLRFFVDSVKERMRITPALKREIEARFEELGQEHVDDPVWIARLTADLTCEAGIVVRPMNLSPTMESLTLVNLGGRRILGVVVTSNGWVQKRVVHLPSGFEENSLHDLASRLSGIWRGLSLDMIQKELDNKGSGQSFSPWEYSLLKELFSSSEDGEVQVRGAENLVEDESFSDLESIRNAVRTLGDRARIATEWREALQDRETKVFIGAESPLTAEGNLGMVASLFYRGRKRAGAVGVVGPRRMNYLRVLPLIECIGQTLSKRLGRDE